MTKLVDLTGQRFGRLIVIRRSPSSKRVNWLCQCDCGGECSPTTYCLRSGRTQSCGCIQRERTGAAARISSRTHGKTDTPEYRSWSAMRSRCTNPHSTGYDRYGGRGIKVCDRWLNSFEQFLADMGHRHSAKYSLDRIDQDGDYEPINCRWATRIEQANNRRDNRIVIIDGRKITLRNAVRYFGCVISITSAWRRIKKGWPHKNAVSKPSTR